MNFKCSIQAIKKNTVVIKQIALFLSIKCQGYMIIGSVLIYVREKWGFILKYYMQPILYYYFIQWNYLKISCFLDPINKDYIIGNGGIQKLESSLCIGDDHITITCITTLMYLYAPEIKTGNYKYIFQVKYLKN